MGGQVWMNIRRYWKEELRVTIVAATLRIAMFSMQETAQVCRTAVYLMEVRVQTGTQIHYWEVHRFKYVINNLLYNINDDSG